MILGGDIFFVSFIVFIWLMVIRRIISVRIVVFVWCLEVNIIRRKIFREILDFYNRKILYIVKRI